MDNNIVRSINQGPMGPQGPVKVNHCVMNRESGFEPVVRIYPHTFTTTTTIPSEETSTISGGEETTMPGGGGSMEEEPDFDFDDDPSGQITDDDPTTEDLGD